MRPPGFEARSLLQLQCTSGDHHLTVGAAEATRAIENGPPWSFDRTSSGVRTIKFSRWMGKGAINDEGTVAEEARCRLYQMISFSFPVF